MHKKPISSFRRSALISSVVASGLTLIDPTQTLGATIPVTECTETSLRTAVTSAADSDTVDLSQLSPCTITLTSGAIKTSAADLLIEGPVHGQVIIDGNLSDRVLYADHQEAGGNKGSLRIGYLTLRNGKAKPTAASGDWLGGCVYTSGNIQLFNTVIEGCVAAGDDSHNAAGGGIFSGPGGYVLLTRSTLSGNVSSNTGTGNAFGGGIYVSGVLYTDRSSLTDNHTMSANHRDTGAAVYAPGRGNVTMSSSLIAGNTASFAAVWVYANGDTTKTTTIINSTISDNHSTGTAGLVSYQPIAVWNSTIASNVTIDNVAAGLFAGASLALHSTLLADNIAQGNPLNLLDVQIAGDTAITGEKNLITATDSGVPLGTLTQCPLLGPLADNGGATLTHAIAHNSPVIDAGDNIIDGGNTISLSFDQRGTGFPRTTGNAPDIGAFEYQGAQDDRVFLGEFENRCQ